MNHWVTVTLNLTSPHVHRRLPTRHNQARRKPISHEICWSLHRIDRTCMHLSTLQAIFNADSIFHEIFVVEVYVELRCLRVFYPFYLTLKAIFLLHFSAYYWYVIGSIPSVRVGIATSSLRVCGNAIPKPSRRASNHISNIYYNLKMNKE